MATNYWASSQCQRWVLRRADIEAARDEDRRYVDPLELEGVSVWCINTMTLLGQRLQTRQRVIATAIVYFQRFYTKNAYASTDPILVLVTCLYLASKVEEAPVRIRVLCAEASRMMQELGYHELPNHIPAIAEMEFFLLEELEFDLVVFHPYDTLSALCRTCVDCMMSRTAQKAEMHAALLQMGWTVVNDMYRTSLPLEHPPYLLAVAALYLALVAVPPMAEEVQVLVQGEARTDSTLLDVLAGMNVSLPVVVDIVQDMLSRYDLWRRLTHTSREGLAILHDHASMFKRLYHMRKEHCQSLVDNALVQDDTAERDLRTYGPTT